MTCITDFLTLYVLLVYACVLQMHTSHKVPFLLAA